LRSVKPKISRPKPMENVLTDTPHQRATMKCPNSWTNTTMLSTNRKVTIGMKTPEVDEATFDSVNISLLLSLPRGGSGRP